MGWPFMYFMSLDKIALYLIKVFSICLRAKIAFSFGEEERKEMGEELIKKRVLIQNKEFDSNSFFYSRISENSS